jgi:hypothetical protein
MDGALDRIQIGPPQSLRLAIESATNSRFGNSTLVVGFILIRQFDFPWRLTAESVTHG